MRVHVMQQCRPPACRLVRWWKEIITRRTPSPRAAGFGQSWYGVFRVGGSSTSSSLHCHDAFQMPGALQSSDISRPPHTLNDAPCPPLRLVFASTASSSQAQNLKRRVLAALIFIASVHRSSCHRQRCRALCEQCGLQPLRDRASAAQPSFYPPARLQFIEIAQSIGGVLAHSSPAYPSSPRVHIIISRARVARSHFPEPSLPPPLSVS